MNLQKISAAHNTDNPVSGRVMIKAGVVKEGIVSVKIRYAIHKSMRVKMKWASRSITVNLKRFTGLLSRLKPNSRI
jgi:RimJ/RimL family protein N-acetyltransferase